MMKRESVSYTHLDVYKRQYLKRAKVLYAFVLFLKKTLISDNLVVRRYEKWYTYTEYVYFYERWNGGVRMQAILLAGGLGTRLQSVVSDRPKPMALIGDKPFMEYVVHELARHGIQDIIFAGGYKAVSYTHLDVYKRQAFASHFHGDAGGEYAGIPL